ncbi:MAG: RNA polymerase sigma factor RpoD/SigA [candidate division WOR-3 bacterium]
MRITRRITERGLKQFVEEISKYPVLTREEEAELAQRIREKGDNEAKEKLILSNLRNVLHLCKNFLDYGLTLTELINAGTQGLIHAIEKFDERKGYRLSTYSTWWIKRSLHKAIYADQEIVSKSHLAKRIKSFIPAFVQDKGREPTIQEIAQHFRVSTHQVSNALTELLPILSLDETYSSDEESTPLVETISIDQMSGEKFVLPSPEEILKQKQETERIQKALKKLAPREKEIIERNFGLGDYEAQSLEDISRLMNITKERVRQIRENALKKLKLILPRIK